MENLVSYVRTGALIIYIILPMLIFHNFWTYGGMEHWGQMIHILENVLIMCSVLLFVAFGGR